MSTRPKPEQFPTWWSYHQAHRLWLRRTGGHLTTTIALALIVLVTVAGAATVHLHLRRTC